MARQVSSFMIGLFVTIGIIIVVSVIVWVGASRFFEKGTMYVTYFDESVQGLQKDSTVKYRGVDVGRVVSIGVAPDNKLIEVMMKINLSADLKKNTVSQLKSMGLTGIVFIELDSLDSHILDISPKIDFASPHPIIPSRSSEVRQILSGIDKVIDKVATVDFPGISDQLKATAKSAEEFLAGNRTNSIMLNLESSTAAFDKSMNRLDKVIAEGNLPGILTEVRQTLTETHSLMSLLQNEIINKVAKVDFPGISDQIKATAKSAENFLAGDRTNRIMLNLESSTTSLDKSMSGLDKIISESNLAGTLTEVRQTLAETRSLMSLLQTEIKGMKLSEAGGKTNQAIDFLSRSMRESAVNIQVTTENLKSFSEGLERFIERLEANPSDLIFSKPAEQKREKAD